MSWESADRSCYYQNAREPEDLSLPGSETALKEKDPSMRPPDVNPGASVCDI
jgi:hypothetical protein